MNKTLLLIIIDFLFLNLIALTRWEKAAPVQPHQAPVTQVAGNTPPRDQDLVDLMRLSLQDEQASRTKLAQELQQTQVTLENREQNLTQLQSARTQLETSLAATQQNVKELGQKAAAATEDATMTKEQLARLQRDRAVLEKEQEHQFLKQAEAASLAPAPPAEPAAPITVSIPLEGWPPGEAEAVHDFRVYVRLRLGAQKGDVSEAFKQKLVASAPDYGVKEGIAMQVVDAEAKRLLVLQQNMDKYREDFKDVASDGVVSPDERTMLLKRQKTLHLSDDQVKEVEIQFPVR